MPLDINLQPKQAQLLELLMDTGTEVPTILGYGGARGGGKSAAIRYCMLLLLMEVYPNVSGIILRRVADEVKRNHIDPLFREFPWLREYYSETYKTLTFPNGSTLRFGYAETKEEVDRKFWGVEYMFIFVDQAEQFSEGELIIINSCNRWPNVPAGTCKTALFFNPGGTSGGGEYLRRVFYVNKYTLYENSKNYKFIQAYGWDNFEWFRGQVPVDIGEFYALDHDERFELFINHTSEGRKMNSLPPALRQGHLMGTFESFAGQYFAGVWDQNVIVIPPQTVYEITKPWWSRWMALDWGFAHYFCNLWFVYGKLSPELFTKYLGGTIEIPVEVVIVYKEYLDLEVGEPEVANKIIEKTDANERQYISHHFLSHEAYNVKGIANTTAEMLGKRLSEKGFPFPSRVNAKAGSRINGWRFCYNAMRQTYTMRGQENDEDKCKEGPLLLISANCPELIDALPLLTRDPDDLEDVIKTTAKADDIGDSFRYGLFEMLGTENAKPKSIIRNEIWEAGTNINHKVMSMRLWDNKQKQNARNSGRRRRR